MMPNCSTIFGLWFSFHLCMLWVVSDLFFHTKSSSWIPVSYWQLNIYIWMPCRYVKTHRKLKCFTHSVPKTCSVVCIPYLAEESTVHPAAQDVLLVSSVDFTPLVSHQVQKCSLFTVSHICFSSVSLLSWSVRVSPHYHYFIELSFTHVSVTLTATKFISLPLLYVC